MRLYVSLYLTLLLFYGAFAEENKDERGLAETLAKRKIKCVQTELQKGTKDVPSFAPLNITNLDIDMDALQLPNFSGKLLLNEFLLNGIVDWVVADIKVKLLPTRITMIELIFPNITLNSEFSANLKIANTEILGESTAKLNFENFSFKLVIDDILQDDGKIWQTPTITSNHDKLEFNLSNLLVNGKDISPMVNVIVNALPSYKEDIIAVLEYFIMAYLNSDKIDNVSMYETYGIIEVMKGIQAILVKCL